MSEQERENESPVVSSTCIYTIVKRPRLEKLANDRSGDTFEERQPWTTGERIWRQATATGEVVPVLFADAGNTADLLWWGFLTDVRVADGRTTYRIDVVRQFAIPHRQEELTLVSTQRPLDPGFIRPYAICRTPDFLRSAVAAETRLEALNSAES